MTSKVNPAALVAGLMALACGGPTSDPILRERALDLPEWTLSEPRLEIGVIEGAPEYQLYRVNSAFRLDNQSIVIANSGTSELRAFDSTGTFLWKTGGRGGGPGEFQKLQAGWREGDSIAAFDYGRLTYFDKAGEFLATSRMRPDSTNRFPFNLWLYRRNLVDGVPPSPHRETVSRALDRLPPPTTEPGYNYVRADEVGNLWIGDDIKAGELRSGWTIYDSLARPIARLQTPPGLQIFEATATDILGRWWNSEGVEFVRLYDLHKTNTPPPTDPAPHPFIGITNNEIGPIITLMRSTLRNLVVAQESYFADHGTYGPNRHDLNIQVPDSVYLDIVTAYGRGWLAVLVDPRVDVMAAMAVGDPTPAGWFEGSPVIAEPKRAPSPKQ